MLILISPAKRLDENSKVFAEHTLSRNPAKTQELVEKLKQFNPANLQKLMGINPKLAELNVDRFYKFRKRHNIQNSLQALFAFNGDVFLGLDAKSFSDETVRYAQDHLRILSGLYAVLRPLDLIQPYRLEMGTKLNTSLGNDLYSFWGDHITRMIKSDLNKTENEYLLNLASNEYFKSIDVSKIKVPVLTATFKEYRNGQLKFFPVFGKKARGLMTRYVLENKISDPEELKGFNTEGYSYEEKLSSGEEFVFVR